MFGYYIVYYILGLVLIPGIILGIVAQIKVQTNFSKYNQVQTQHGITASQVARHMLDSAGYGDVEIKKIKGELTDNFNPKTNTVSLSQSVHGQSSVGAVGVAAHEIGHVFQHKQGYGLIKARNALVPVLNISSLLAWPLIIIGLMLEIFYYTTGTNWLIYIGIGMYALNILFCLITLPVEINASKRAEKMLSATGEMNEEEVAGVKKVLNAAAWTYVAALVTSVLSLLRLVLFVFLARGDRR